MLMYGSDERRASHLRDALANEISQILDNFYEHMLSSTDCMDIALAGYRLEETPTGWRTEDFTIDVGFDADGLPVVHVEASARVQCDPQWLTDLVREVAEDCSSAEFDPTD